MDPFVTTIVAALVAGAGAAAKDVATDAVKSAYSGLKRLISDRYEKVAPFVEAVEAAPDSNPEQQVLANQLDRSNAGGVEELRKAAQLLLEQIETLKDEPKADALFDFGQLRAARNFELRDIHTVGTVLRAKDATFEGDFRAEGIRVVTKGTDPEKN